MGTGTYSSGTKDVSSAVTAVRILDWGHISTTGSETLALLTAFTTPSHKAVLNPAVASQWLADCRLNPGLPSLTVLRVLGPCSQSFCMVFFDRLVLVVYGLSRFNCHECSVPTLRAFLRKAVCFLKKASVL